MSEDWHRASDQTAAMRASISQTLSAEQAAEDFIQAEVDRAPEPLHRLGAYLYSLLDEDRWATANRMLLGSIFEVNRLAAENVCLRAALEKIAERRFSDAGEPFDEALAIADAALGVKPN